MLPLLYLVTWLTDCAGFLVLFATGRQLAEQSTDPTVLGAIGAVFSLGAALSNAVAGRLADRLGRRPVAVGGAALLLASVAGVAALDPRRWPYYAAYTAFGFALGVLYPPVIAWLARGRHGHRLRRAYLGFCLAFNVGIVSGQMGGGWLFDRGAAWPVRVALLLIAADVVLLLVAPEPPLSLRGKQAEESAGPATDRARSAAFARLCWVANAGGTFGMSVVIFLFPRLCVDLGIPADHQGLLQGAGRAVTVGVFGMMYLTTAWLHRFSVALFAQALGVAGLLAVAGAATEVGLLAGLTGLSLLTGYNYFAGLYYSTAGSAVDRQGAGSGTHEATLALGLAGGSLCGGLAAASYGSRAPFVLAAAVVAALTAVQVGLYCSSRDRR